MIEIKNVHTELLIKELKRRNLTQEDILELQSLLSPTSSQNAIREKSQINDISDVETLARSAIRKSFFGKLPIGAHILGKEVDKNTAGGFFNHGPDEISISLNGRGAFGVHDAIYRFQDKLEKRMRYQMLSIIPSATNEQNIILTIHFFQDYKQVDSRKAYTAAHVCAEFTKSDLEDVLAHILINPNSLEDLYQGLFPNLDETPTNSGVRRVKTYGFYLLQGELLKRTKDIERYDLRTVNALLDKVQTYRYSNGPYGNGEEFLPLKLRK